MKKSFIAVALVALVSGSFLTGCTSEREKFIELTQDYSYYSMRARYGDEDAKEKAEEIEKELKEMREEIKEEYKDKK